MACLVHSSCNLETLNVDTHGRATDESGSLQSQIEFDKSEVEKEVVDRKLTVFHWGWHRFTFVINCRAEELREKPMFRKYLGSFRCAVLAEGTYEWSDNIEEKKPYKYVKKDQSLQYIAGLYNEQGEVITLTVKSAGSLSKIHHRMPVYLTPSDLPLWLDPSTSFDSIIDRILDTSQP